MKIRMLQGDRDYAEYAIVGRPDKLLIYDSDNGKRPWQVADAVNGTMISGFYPCYKSKDEALASLTHNRVVA